MTAAAGLLGRGAMGVVELARAPDGSPVALKRVAPVGSAPEMALARARLRREAEVLASLEHPAIVPVLAVEDHGDDLVIVMPALAGSPADRVAAGGPLAAAEVVALGHRLLGALVAAHQAGMVHRDVKPANVLLDDRGEAALGDFGIASGAAFTAGLTSPGTVVGTPSFMAPEQARGERAGPPADVYALGATLLYACVGADRWHAAGSPPALVSEAPAVLRAPLTAMLDPDPPRRPSAAALLAGTSGTAILARPHLGRHLARPHLGRHGGGHRMATATSADGTPAVASVPRPGCLGRHSATLHLAVHAAAGTSPADSTLVRSGGW